MTGMTDGNMLAALREARAALRLDRRGAVADDRAGTRGGAEVQLAVAVGLSELLDQLVEIATQLKESSGAGANSDTDSDTGRGDVRAEAHRDLEQLLRSAAACARELRDQPSS